MTPSIQTYLVGTQFLNVLEPCTYRASSPAHVTRAGCTLAASHHAPALLSVPQEESELAFTCVASENINTGNRHQSAQSAQRAQ